MNQYLGIDNIQKEKNDHKNVFGVLIDQTLFSENTLKQNIQALNTKQNDKILSIPYSNKKQRQVLSHNKENTSTYIKEGSISLHFNNKREMVLQPFTINATTFTHKYNETNNKIMDSNKKKNEQNQFNESYNKYQQKIIKTSEQNDQQCESSISIEFSADWVSPQQQHSNSGKMEIQEESFSQMTSHGVIRDELQEVARNLNLMDLTQGIDESPTSDNKIHNEFDLIKESTQNDDHTLDKEISTISDIFLKEIGSNILNTNKNALNCFVSFEKKQNIYKKRNYDRFIPSRVETDTYKFFLASEDQYSKKQNQLDEFGNPIQTNNGDTTRAGSSQSSIANSNNMREEQNRQLYHNLLQAHFLENNKNTTSAYSALSGDDISIFSSQCSDNVSHNLKQKSYRPLKKLFSYGEGSSQQNSSLTSQQYPSASQLISTISSSSSNKKRNMYGSLINLPDYNNYNHDETPKLKINPRPYKILEAPTLKNDFYLNLLDWSPSNLVSVGLENYVYVLSGANQSVKTQFNIPEYIDPSINQKYNDQADNIHLSDYYNMVCSVGWSQRSDHIAVGDRQGKIYLFDLAKNQFLRVMQNHKGRVGQIAWNGHLIASGSRDRNIVITDVRDKNPYSVVFKGHEQEICGMKWSFDEQTLASGGNDNKVFLWSLKMNGKLAKISQSKAAVKALGFSPHQHNILAFGGGTADRCIRIYDTQQLKQIDCIDTGSQVCNLIFSKNSRQIISTHGYSLNQIIVWNQSNMKKVATLTGHSQRVLYLAESPCGQNILTGAADETIRFWNIYRNDIVNELSPSSFGLR